MKSDLEVAAMAQKSLLPKETLEIGGVSFASSFKPYNSDPVILKDPGFPIGCFQEAYYVESSLCLAHRDRLYLYSDGITEATNPDDEQFGEGRLVDALDQGRNLQLEESVSSVVRRVVEWCGDEKLVDDISVLAVEIAGNSG